MQNVNIKLDLVVPEDTTLTTDDLITIVDRNRDRIRTLSGLVVTVCGLLLSASFVVLFFALKEKALGIDSAVPVLLLSSTACLVVAILLSVYSALIARPEAVQNKLELLDLIGRAYHRERRRVVASVVLLVFGVAIFALSMAVFAYQAV